MPNERVTVTLPRDLVDEVDRNERNRSKFIREAIQRELEHRRREALRHSLLNPHPESREIGELGVESWVEGLPESDEELLDPGAGTDVEWSPGKGWTEIER